MKRSDLSSIEPEIITGWLSGQQMQHDAHVWHWRQWLWARERDPEKMFKAMSAA